MNTFDDAEELRLAAEPLDAEDLAMLEEMAELWATADPVPDGLVERIQFELTLDALQAEVATLTQLDLAGSGARTSSTEAVRTVTFSAESLTAMVTITHEPNSTVRVDGWVAPGGRLLVEVLLSGAPRRTYTDIDGRFVLDGLPAELAKFALHTVDDTGDPHIVVSPTIEL